MTINFSGLQVYQLLAKPALHKLPLNNWKIQESDLFYWTVMQCEEVYETNQFENIVQCEDYEPGVSLLEMINQEGAYSIIKFIKE